MRIRLFSFALVSLLAGCDTPSAGPSVAQSRAPVVVSGGTPLALAPQPAATPRIAATPQPTSRPQPAAPAPADALAAKTILPAPTPTAGPTRTPPADPSERAVWTLERADADADAGRPAEALKRLDSEPVPAAAADLVNLRRAELALAAGDGGRAAAALEDPSLSATTNRVVLVRAAEAAERAEQWRRAADLWLRASRQPTWFSERTRLLRASARAAARAGDVITAAERVSQSADLEGKNPDPTLISELVQHDDLTAYHVGLLRQAQGNSAEAIARFRRYLQVAPGGPYAAQARERLGRLTAPGGSAGPSAWSQARDADTAEAYAAFRRAHPNDARVPEALFREGLAQYASGAHAAALDTWAVQIAPSSGPETRARALYWSGKTLAELGDVEAARDRWRQSAAIRPTSYYTLRSADRLADRDGWPNAGTALPPAAISPEESAEAERWLAGWAQGGDPGAADRAALDRAALFARIGYERTAGAELDSLIEGTSNPRAIYLAGRLALEHRLWLSSVRAGLRLGRLSPETTTLDAPRAIRRMAYPSGYADLVRAQSARRELGPVLMLSLIRQESLFDPQARSTADARGLTQVMPATGAEIARTIGFGPFTADSLHDPTVSIDFGARFLAGQIIGFRGDVFRAVAAYNAGGGAARRWAPSSSDPDVFVESIAYAETREYVKSVYSHHAAYRSLLAGG